MELFVCDGEIKEAFAGLTHRIRNEWLLHAINTIKGVEDPEVAISVLESMGQTPYNALPEPEKEFYRSVIDEYVQIINNFFGKDTKRDTIVS
jgi:hypothetical protein